jgi:Domain of unknown function (DUF4937
MRRVARPQNMLLKRIVCDVPEDLRAGFSTAQEVWQTTAGAAGFQGQIGGFVDGTAQILALWSSRKQYQRFMSDTHDAVASSARQRDWYTSIAIDLYDFIFQMPGSNSDMASALSHATFARIAECEVHPNREAHFLWAQESIWRSGMAQAADMLGGAFWRSSKQAHRYLVTTLWIDGSAHARYKALEFQRLLEQAAPDQDVVALHGVQLRLLPHWYVTRSRS